MKTKNLLLIFLMLILFIGVKGQGEYIPLPEENVVWKMNYYPYGGQTVPHADIPEGDTIINGITYKKIYRHIFDNEQSMNVISKNYVGSFRNDVENKMVYFYTNNEYNPEEKILYDFSVQVGDTLFSKDYCDGFVERYVLRIDTIQVADGTYRKAFGLWIEPNPVVDPYPNLWWIIEGIGFNEGLLYHMDDFDDNGNTLNCMYTVNENGTPNQVIYEDMFFNEYSSHTGCTYIATADMDFEPEELMHVYPNPIITSGCVRFKQNYALRNHILTLYNVHGEKIKTFDNLSEEIPMIFGKDYPSGIYLLTLSHHQQIIQTKKIIIK